MAAETADSNEFQPVRLDVMSRRKPPEKQAHELLANRIDEFIRAACRQRDVSTRPLLCRTSARCPFFMYVNPLVRRYLACTPSHLCILQPSCARSYDQRGLRMGHPIIRKYGRLTLLPTRCRTATMTLRLGSSLLTWRRPPLARILRRALLQQTKGAHRHIRASRAQR